MRLPVTYNIRNLAVRKGTTLATAASVALTVAVFLMVMALAKGLDLALATSGEPLNLILVRDGSTAELSSDVPRESLDAVRYLDGVARENGEPLVSPELVTLIYRARKGQSQGANVTIRGVGPMAAKLRSGFRIVEGRMFQPGLAEAVVSRRIASRFQGLGVGDSFRIQGTDFKVVGLFEAGGKAFESEVWTTIASLQSATKRESFTSILARASDRATLDALALRSAGDKRVRIAAIPEQKWYADQQGIASAAIKGLGVFIAFVMAIGSAFAGMNTMYAAVAKRTREIGTLRVLGFGRGSILVSFLLESVAISLVGVAGGLLLALPLNFVSTGTTSFQSFSEIAFNFRVTPDLAAVALLFGVAIGLVGALLPSLRASRLKIVDALRES
jgi:putative ABC transport system permease protein